MDLSQLASGEAASHEADYPIPKPQIITTACSLKQNPPEFFFLPSQTLKHSMKLHQLKHLL